MKAAVLRGPQDIRTENVSDPTVETDGVIIRVKACGVCGSDLHVYKEEGHEGTIFGHELSGDVVEVFASDNTYLATGHWAPGSIAVRIFSFGRCTPDRDFFRKKLDDAFRYRVSAGIAGNNATDAWRLARAGL